MVVQLHSHQMHVFEVYMYNQDKEFGCVSDNANALSNQFSVSIQHDHDHNVLFYWISLQLVGYKEIIDPMYYTQAS